MSFVLDIIQATFFSVYCAFANIQSQLSGYGHASETKQCYGAHAYSTRLKGSRKQMGQTLCSAWHDRQSHPCV